MLFSLVGCGKQIPVKSIVENELFGQEISRQMSASSGSGASVEHISAMAVTVGSENMFSKNVREVVVQVM